MKRLLKQIVKKSLITLSPMINDRYYKSFLKKNLQNILARNVLHHSLPGEKVLIMAPHPDDEVIGCGGAMIQYVNSGKDVHIAYLTDGANRGLSTNATHITAIRMDEAKKMASLLKIPEEHLHFLKAEDGNLKNSGKERDFLDILKFVKPDSILLPAPIDTHTDHIAASSLLMKVLETNHDLKGDLNNAVIYLYGVQSPISQLYSNITLDFTGQRDMYIKLLKCYPSQGDLTEYATLIHHYYGMVFGLKYGEVFIRTSLSDFCKVTREFHDSFETSSKELIRLENPLKFTQSHDSSLKFKELLLKYHDQVHTGMIIPAETNESTQ